METDTDSRAKGIPPSLRSSNGRLYEAVARPRAAADGIGCGYRMGAIMSEGSLGPSCAEEDWYRGRPAGWEGHAHLTRGWALGAVC